METRDFLFMLVCLVVTVCDLVEGLIQNIDNSALPASKKGLMTDALQRICRPFEKDKRNAFALAIEMLEHFQKKLPSVLKEYPLERTQFTAETQAIIDATECAVKVDEKKHTNSRHP